MEKGVVMLLVVLSCMLGTATANSYQEDYALENGDARFIYLNSTSTATSLTLLGALILLGVIFYLVYAGGLFGASSAGNRNDQYYTNQGYDDGQYYTGRSAGSSIDFSNLNVIQWISMMQEIYEKFDYNDIECQKRLICEVMQSPEYFGEASDKMRTGFEYARFLEVLSMPDDFREILDEYIDASERAVGVKTCREYFDCPYSLKDSVKRNFYGNAL